MAELPITVAALIVFGLVVAGIYRYTTPWSLAKKTLLGLALGLAFGALLQLLTGAGVEAARATVTDWVGVVGTAYVKLLKMIVVPLILVMIVAAVFNMRTIGAMGRIATSVIGILVATTVVSALVGAAVVGMFDLSAEGILAEEIVGETREADRLEVVEERAEMVDQLSFTDLLVRFVPDNIVEDLAGLRPTSIISVVLFAAILGLACLRVANTDAAKADAIEQFITTAQSVVLELTNWVLRLTPYGVLALMVKVSASASWADIVRLGSFIAASYLAIGVMFLVHFALLLVARVDVRGYLRDTWSVLTFAFASRSSAATIPLNIDAQVNRLGVPEPVANVAASFGATIGQNGCAGVYPAMLAVMVGIDPWTIEFLSGLVVIVAISSFGVAGVGGGATFAALLVLPALGLPVVIVALLISIEPLIDMARTALNVNGSMTAGVLTSRWVGRAEAVRAAA